MSAFFLPLIKHRPGELCGAGQGKGSSPGELVPLPFQCPLHPPQTFHFIRVCIFVSQVASSPLGGTPPISAGPAWMVVPAGRSALVVARGSRWAQARWDTTLPTSHLKPQSLSNVWAPLIPGTGRRPPLPCCHLSPGPQGEMEAGKIDALHCLAFMLQDTAWGVVGSAAEGSTDDVCRVREAGAGGMLATPGHISWSVLPGGWLRTDVFNNVFIKCFQDIL